MTGDTQDPDQARTADLQLRFADAVLTSQDSTPGVEWLPNGLSQACVQTLPFDGASIRFGLLSDGWLPLGSSDPTAAAAERLHFAAGAWPSTLDHRDQAQQAAAHDPTATSAGWYRRIRDHTPYRASVAIRAGGPLSGVVVLDLYSVKTAAANPELRADVGTVADAIGERLAADFSIDDGRGLPAVFWSPAVLARQQVWVAIGILAQRHHVGQRDALALLRGMAFVHDMDLETSAEALLAGHDLD